MYKTEEEYWALMKIKKKELKKAMSPLNALKKDYIDSVLNKLNEMRDLKLISEEYCKEQRAHFLKELSSPSEFKEAMSNKILSVKEKLKNKLLSFKLLRKHKK